MIDHLIKDQMSHLMFRDFQRLPRTWDLEEICSRIAGGEALSQIALSYGKSKQALWKYLNKEDERRKQYL